MAIAEAFAVRNAGAASMWPRRRGHVGSTGVEERSRGTGRIAWRPGVSVVLDFPANTVTFRNWMRSLIAQAGVAHELHVLDIPDARASSGFGNAMPRASTPEHPYQVSEATFDLFISYFVPPGPDEGFNIVVHTA